METIAEYTLPAREFVFGSAVATHPDVEVEVEKVFGNGQRALNYVWVYGDTGESFVQSVREQSPYEEFVDLDGGDRRDLYRGRLPLSADSLTRALVERDVSLLTGVGNHERWQFRCRFDDREAASSFQRYCAREGDLDITLEAVYAADRERPDGGDLTPRQRETLLTALREGYFDIPRRVTLVDLAERLEISDQAVSERMRRGEAKVIRSVLEN